MAAPIVTFSLTVKVVVDTFVIVAIVLWAKRGKPVTLSPIATEAETSSSITTVVLALASASPVAAVVVLETPFTVDGYISSPGKVIGLAPTTGCT